jgi:TPP-dependent pyruvate/acetoin dehydrogenase alpha subunit
MTQDDGDGARDGGHALREDGGQALAEDAPRVPGWAEATSPIRGIALADALGMYRRMIEFRAFEELVGEGVRDGLIHGEIHLAIGQEAVAAGLEPYLRAGDAMVSTHRPHLHALIAGVDPVRLLGEIFERADGLCGGKGGHMHLFDAERSFMCTGIVGASALLALGYALHRKREMPQAMSVAVLGDGAVNHGTFSESLNIAALWALPVLFLIEDNGYAISVRRSASTAGEVRRRGEAYGIPAWACDGTDPEAVWAAAGPAVARIRAGEGPAILVALVHRFRGHYEGDLDHYRTEAEREQMRAEHDPLARWRQRLSASGASGADLDSMAESGQQRVREWVAHARAMPWPEPADALAGVFA